MQSLKVTNQVLTVLVFLGLAHPIAHAAPKSAGKPMIALRSNLSTDIHFDGVTVRGRRQSPFGASAVIESEKETPELIDYRRDYNDRIRRSASGR